MSEIEKGLRSLSILAGFRSVSGRGICARTGVTRKSEASFVYGTVWSFAGTKQMNLGKCKWEKPCRAHSPVCELFPSVSTTLDSSQFGFPLLLVETRAREKRMLVLRFIGEVGGNAVVSKRFRPDLKLEVLPLARLRDYHIWCFDENYIHVHVVGSRAFNHS